MAAAAAAAAQGGGGAGARSAAGPGAGSVPRWATAAPHMLPAERERLRLQAKEMFYHGYDSVRAPCCACCRVCSRLTSPIAGNPGSQPHVSDDRTVRST